MSAVVEGFISGWNAVSADGGLVVVEPLPQAPASSAYDADSGLPDGLPTHLVVVTAANPGGVVLSSTENTERHERLLERISELEPFPGQVPSTYATVGGSPHGKAPSEWLHREEGVALDISRDEAAMLAAEFGQLAFYSFEGSYRLLIGAGDEGVLAVQRYRTHRG